MKHLYLFTLEITPLVVGKTYDELPSHLTLMSRFWSDLPANELAEAVRPWFEHQRPRQLVFDETIKLGPKKLTVHLVDRAAVLVLHDRLRRLLDAHNVVYQYPQYIGANYVPHVTHREGAWFGKGDESHAAAAYLVEIIDKKRVVRARLALEGLAL